MDSELVHERASSTFSAISSLTTLGLCQCGYIRMKDHFCVRVRAIILYIQRTTNSQRYLWLIVGNFMLVHRGVGVICSTCFLRCCGNLLIVFSSENFQRSAGGGDENGCESTPFAIDLYFVVHCFCCFLHLADVWTWLMMEVTDSLSCFPMKYCGQQKTLKYLPQRKFKNTLLYWIQFCFLNLFNQHIVGFIRNY